MIRPQVLLKICKKSEVRFSDSRNMIQLLSLDSAKFKLSLHQSIEDIQDLWNDIAPRDIFFSSGFLQHLEEYPMDGFRFFYGLVYENEEPIGILYFQHRHLELQKSLNIHTHKDDALSKLLANFKKGLANHINFSTLICGNVLLTGRYSFYFRKGRLSYKDEFSLVEQSTEVLRKALKKEQLDFGLVLTKDYPTSLEFEKQNIDQSSFTEFSVQPNMLMELDPKWEDFDDYLMALRSKYRVNAKRAFKKAAPIHKRKLSLSEIKNFQNDIYRLYRATSDVADFNLFLLREAYFTGLAERFPEHFEMYGYFLDDELVGFFSYFINFSELDAHFLGYNTSYNQPYQLYLNMLYDLINAGITHQCHQIKFSRTALEIKSSVGAEAEEMNCYLKHRKKIPNTIISPLLNLLVPDEEWTPRNPLK